MLWLQIIAVELILEVSAHNFLNQVRQTVWLITCRQVPVTCVDHHHIWSLALAKLKTCEFQMEPQPALSAIVENVVHDELHRRSLVQSTTSHQVNESLSTDILREVWVAQKTWDFALRWLASIVDLTFFVDFSSKSLDFFKRRILAAVRDSFLVQTSSIEQEND